MKVALMVSLYTIISNKTVETADLRNVIAGVTWLEAKSQCGGNGLEYNLTILSGLEQLDDNPFWIGVYKYQFMTPWMFPRGCYHIHDQQYQTDTSAINTIGLCQQYCNSAVTFGYQDSICQCLNTDALSNMSKTSLSNCINNQPGVMMVYSVFIYPVSDNDVNHCMLSVCTSTDNRIQHIPQDCSKTNSTIAVICDDTYSPINPMVWDADYERAKDTCILENKLLLSPNDCPLWPGIYAWTSAFREQVILEAVDASNVSMTTIFACMSGIRNVNEKYGVRVSARSCSDLLSFFVCASVILSTIDGTENHGVLIGGTIGGIATILIIVPLLMWIWWRQRVKDLTSKEVNVSTNQQSSHDEHQDSSAQYEEPISREDRTTDATYTMLNVENKPQEEYMNLDNTTEEQNRINEAGYTILNTENKQKQEEYMIMHASTEEQNRTAIIESVYDNA